LARTALTGVPQISESRKIAPRFSSKTASSPASRSLCLNDGPVNVSTVAVPVSAKTIFVVDLSSAPFRPKLFARKNDRPKEDLWLELSLEAL
jgi:hypothetical protein